jgi:DNA-binding CsgD family transcriptional regulator
MDQISSALTSISMSDLVMDKEIYPRNAIDHRRVDMFAENMRDGFTFEPIDVEVHPEERGKYRILDGVHRWQAYKALGANEIEAHIVHLDGRDPLLYAAKKAIGPRQLNEEDARETARRAFQKNPRLTSAEIGKAIGRARRTVDSYIADLKAATRLGIDLKIFRMNSLGIPQDRIAKRLGQTRETVRDHLAKMAVLPNPPNADLSRGFTVSQVAEKHACPACCSVAKIPLSGPRSSGRWYWGRSP